MVPSLDTIPLEVLEHIALFVGWEQLSGPPKNLVSLCLTCKFICDSLSLSRNPSLYASLFRRKFDTSAPLRRLGPDHTTVQCLADELRTRFAAMQRLRGGIGSREYLLTDRKADLWMAVIMMLENDGKNVIQLRNFGRVQEWLHTYFLEDSGGSFIQRDIQARSWPRDNIDNKLALWLLYLLDAEGPSPPCRLYTEILRTYAIGANKYPLAHLWDHFSLHHTPSGTAYRHFGRQLYPIPPAAAISAISGYMARLRQPRVITWGTFPEPLRSTPLQSTPRREASGSNSSSGSSSQQWDCVWERCIRLSKGYLDPVKELRYYRPGSLDGSWEGLFMYAEFGDYTAMLSGEPPQVITETTIGHNLQVWKIREYNLYSSTPSGLSDGPVVPGSVHNAFLPVPILVDEHDHHAVFTHFSQRSIYHRPRQTTDGTNHLDQGILRDVIILGEGHSAWGDFKLKGRVRPLDAFVTILKEYQDGTNDRGSWLYRGYIIGGKYVGRWRDIVTPVDMVGYEGGFELSQRES